MDKLHQSLLQAIKTTAERRPFDSQHDLKTYCGTSDPGYNLSRPQLRRVIKKWLKQRPGLELVEFVRLLDSLYQASSHTEKTSAGLLLGYLPRLRKRIAPVKLDQWLDRLQGWAQIDSLCQSNFTAEELLADWPAWQSLLLQLNKQGGLNKKRASLVLLVKPVRQSKDNRLAGLAFNQIDRLKKEKDKLITKAISWLLRAMIKEHRSAVRDYLEKNRHSLPAVAVRETSRKLTTGKK